LAFLAVVGPLAMAAGCNPLGSTQGRDAGTGETMSRFELACLQCALNYKGCLKNQGVPGAIVPPAGETCESERESCMVRLTPSTPMRDGGLPTAFRFADCPP
jgi:hypothetical protein